MLSSGLRGLAATLAIFAAMGGLADPANTCTDPYWKETLRCAFFPDAVPQANLGSVPVVPAGPLRVSLLIGQVRVRSVTPSRVGCTVSPAGA